LTGINNWKHQGFKAQAMSTTTQENFASSRGIVNGRNDPDHLLVLVHGILARYMLFNFHSQHSQFPIEEVKTKFWKKVRK